MDTRSGHNGDDDDGGLKNKFYIQRVPTSSSIPMVKRSSQHNMLLRTTWRNFAVLEFLDDGSNGGEGI